MIHAERLVKDYATGGARTRALDHVNITIDPGEFVAIMGPSGSGKSTLLHILSFLERPTEGAYQFGGRDMTSLADADLAGIRNRELGFVFQSFNLLGRSSVYENVELPLLYSAVPPRERKAKVERAVGAVGLTDKLLVEASRLSGGQKQRVAIARALVNDPQVIFADEPTGNLDSASGAQVMEILERLNNEGRTIILVTHETYTAEYADRHIRLRDGKIESDSKPGKRRTGIDGFFK
ncbi:ABC transporter ATP-binding protein [Candidatus Parcubacteria bacterium]|nr:MAG: ABC transporter ATP-binding protein [Candidatus Parcubacteria bacterium]